MGYLVENSFIFLLSSSILFMASITFLHANKLIVYETCKASKFGKDVKNR